MRCLLALILSAGCGPDKDAGSGGSTTYIADYHGLEEGASWAYRDDGNTDDSPVQSEILRARHLGEGLVDFRRGSRWADGRTEAVLDYQLGAEFRLQAWEIAGLQGEAELPLGTDQPEHGQMVEADGWKCETSTRGVGMTYYGIFEDVIQYDCTGDAGPAGSFIFALGVGLVHFESKDYTLDLVAPW
jgi:hypothetical protein